MAIYSCHLEHVSRGKGHSAVAAAAYRHRARMVSSYSGLTYDYSEKSDLVSAGLVLPRQAPVWAQNLASLPPHLSSEKLWNLLESHERRRDASLAHSVMVALPREFGFPELARAAKDLARNFASRMQTAVDWVVHSDADGRNPHAHFLAPERPLAEVGFGKKRKPLVDIHGRPQLDRYGRKIWIAHHGFGWREFLIKLRDVVAQILTFHLRRLGHALELSARSYRSRGLDIAPTAHIGRTRYAKKPEHVRELRNEEIQKGRAQQFLARPLVFAEYLGFHRTTFTSADIKEKLLELPLAPPEVATLESSVSQMTPRTFAGTFTAPSRELELMALSSAVSVGLSPRGPSLVSPHEIPDEDYASAVRFSTPLAPHSKRAGSVVVFENVDFWPASELDSALRSLPRTTRAYLAYSESPGAAALRGQGASVVSPNVPMFRPAPGYQRETSISFEYEEPEFGY